MKRALRWFIYLCLVLILIVVAAIFSIDRIAKSAAEKRLRQETGMETQIGKFNVGLSSRSVRIENLKLINPPEFGGSTFVELPELFVAYDLEALRNNRLHLKEARINLAQIHIVENKSGKRNTDVFNKKDKEKPGTGSTNRTEKFQFAGIDLLEVSIAQTKFTSEIHPGQNFDRNLGIQKRVFKDIKTEKDLQNVGIILGAQAGFNIFLQQALSDPGEVLKDGANAAKETKKVFEGAVEQLKKK